MIKNSANKLYIGISDDPKVRLTEHNTRRGAKFTKYLPNFKIVLLEKYSDPQKARTREIQIKKWRRDKKEMLIKLYKQGQPTIPNS